MKVVFTDEALKSLKSILLFINDSIGEKQATLIGRALVADALKLEKFPNRGSIEPGLEHLKENHRRIISKVYYKIVYKVEGDAVNITDIFDSRQDPSKMKG